MAFDWKAAEAAASGTDTPKKTGFDWSAAEKAVGIAEDAPEKPSVGFNWDAAASVLDEPKTPATGSMGAGAGMTSGLGDALGSIKDVAVEGGRKLFTPGGQQEMLDDPRTAGFMGAVNSPLNVLGVGDSAVMETELENESRARMDGIDYKGGDFAGQKISPRMTEGLVGIAGRIGLSGGAMPLVEAGAKAIDIAQHEPDKELTDAGSMARIGLAGAVPFAAMKAGGALERGISTMGLGKVPTVAANVAGDLGIGLGAGKIIEAGELTMGQGVDPRSQEFRDAMKIGLDDVVMDAPFALLAGKSGLQQAQARKVRMDADNTRIEADADYRGVQGENIATPERRAEIEGDIQGDLQVEQLREGIHKGYDQGTMQRPQPKEARVITDPIRERYDDGRAQKPEDTTEAVNRARSVALQAKGSGEPQVAQAINDAIDGKPTTPEQRQMMRGMGISPLSLRMTNLQKGADSNGLQQREIQGETASGPQLNKESQEIAATLDDTPAIINAKGKPEKLAKMRAELEAEENPRVYMFNGERIETAGYKRQKSEAGMGVINSRGEQVTMPGKPLSTMGLNAARGSVTTKQQTAELHADPDYKQVRDAIVMTGDKVQKGKTVSEKMDLLRTELFDQFRPVQKAEQAREKLTGESLKAIDSPYKNYRNLNRSIISNVNKAIKTGVVDWDSGKPVAPSVMDVVAPVHGQLNDFEVLLAARRTPEMAKRQEVLPFEEDAARRVTKRIESMPEMREALKGYDAVIDAQLQNMVKSGFKTADEIAAMKKENTLYAPWERVDEDGNIRMSVNPAPGRRIDQPRDPLQRITKYGSKKQIHSPLETSIKNIVQMQSAMEKNAAKRKLVDTIGSVPGLESFSKKLTEAEAKAMDDSKYIVVRRDGVKEYHLVDPEIKKTLDGLAPEEADLLDKTLTGLAQFFRGSVTLDPPFAINNLLRDGMQQAVISRSGLGLPMENQIRGIGMLATKQGRADWKEWKESASNQAIQYGAITSQRELINDMQRRAGTVSNTLFSKDLIDPRNWYKVVTKPAGATVRGLNKTMQVAESLGRVGEYGRVKKQSLKKGYTDAEARAEAEFESADLGDFGMSGRNKKIKNARRWISFFGAAMSFNYREIGALKSPKVLLKAATLYGGMELLNFYMNQDDPEYWNLPDDQRRRYWHYKNDEGKFVGLPKPVGIISYLFSEPIRFLADKFIAGESETGIKDLADGLFESTLPPEAPQFLKTSAELMIGEDGYSFFYDRPIVSQGLSRLPKESQYTERTSLAARGVSQGLSKMGLGSYSPQKIDYFIGSGMGPGVRRVVETGVDPLISKATGQRVPGQSLGPSLTKRNIFFPEDKGSEAVDRFYQRLEEMEEAAAADKLGEPHEDYSKVELKRMRKAADKLAEQRKQLKKHIDDDEKQREIKQRMTATVRNRVDDIMPDKFSEYTPKLPGRPVN